MTQMTLAGEPAPDDDNDFVYYGTDGVHIKIGHSVDHKRRGGELRIHMLLRFPGGELEERRHQRMWREYRLYGEWYSAADELMLWITTQIEPRTRELAVVQGVIKNANKGRRAA